jgi:uncharacterized membrane protein
MLFIGLKLIHLLSIIVWVGGMIFAQVCLRPAVAHQQWADGAAAMNAIRQLVSTNLLLGIITVIVALLT